jgi:site-specific DNA-cytosine methylase
MKVLVACEFSGIVRDAFADKGHHAVSVDHLNSERTAIPPGYHWVCDALLAAYQRGPWDMMIAFPPCTHLAVSGARWFKNKQKEQWEAMAFFKKLVDAPIPKIAIENPIGIMSTIYRRPDQIIQPWQFGHG